MIIVKSITVYQLLNGIQIYGNIYNVVDYGKVKSYMNSKGSVILYFENGKSLKTETKNRITIKREEMEFEHKLFVPIKKL